VIDPASGTGRLAKAREKLIQEVAGIHNQLSIRISSRAPQIEKWLTKTAQAGRTAGSNPEALRRNRSLRLYDSADLGGFRSSALLSTRIWDPAM
jgi:hypothetical protein